MPVDNSHAIDALRASLAYQRSRVEAATLNIARANVALPPGSEHAAIAPGASSPAFAAQIGLDAGTSKTESLSPASTSAATEGSGKPQPAVRYALEPSNPQADEHGLVRYPAVDLAAEMTSMMSATRAYEASVRAYNLLKSMNGAALEIGK